MSSIEYESPKERIIKDPVAAETLLRQKIMDNASILWPNLPNLGIFIRTAPRWSHNTNTSSIYTAGIISPSPLHPYAGHARNQVQALVQSSYAPTMMEATEDLFSRLCTLVDEHVADGDGNLDRCLHEGDGEESEGSGSSEDSEDSGEASSSAAASVITARRVG